MKPTYREYSAVALVTALLFLPFLGATHLFDWDEANFAECAREMLLSGNYGKVTVDFQSFYEKPPLFFWFQALMMRLLGIGEYAARLPNALIGIASMLMIYAIAKKQKSSSIASFWVIFFLISWAPHIYFKSGIIDPLFNFLIFLSLYLYYSNHRWRAALSGIFIGLAILTKGPVALLILSLVIFFYTLVYNSRAFAQMSFWKSNFILFLAASFTAGIWFYMGYREDGGEYIRHFIYYQYELLTQDVATHGQPFYYHFFVLLVACFPASIFMFHKSLWKKSVEKSSTFSMEKLMKVLFWVVLILFSLVKTKIIHYSSLCYFPLTYLAAVQLDKMISKEIDLSKFQKILFAVIGVLWSIALLALPILGSRASLLIPYIKDPNVIAGLEMNVSWPAALMIIGSLYLLGLILFFRFWLHAKNKSILYLSCTFIAVIQLVVYLYIPRVEQISQGGAVDIYSSFNQHQADLQTKAYKSYAIYFYADRLPADQQNPNKYYVCRQSQCDKILEEDKRLKYIRNKGGYVLLKQIEHENQTQNTE